MQKRPNAKAPPEASSEFLQRNIDLANRLLIEAHTSRLETARSNNVVGALDVDEWKREVKAQLASVANYEDLLDFDIFEGL